MNKLQASYLRYLNNCIARQCKSTMDHVDRHKKSFANNRHSAGFSKSLKEITFALTINKAEDVYLYDLDGNKYLDITCGFGVHLFGHSPSFIKDAIRDQLENGISVGPLYSDAAEVAELICSMTGNERCAFFNSGTEAVMVAIRLARAATGKNKIVIFEGAYHGTYDPLLVMKQDPFHQKAVTNIPGIPQSTIQDTYLLKYGEPSSLKFINEHAEELACVLTEPVQSRNPSMVDPNFLKQLQECCNQNNIAFILDEIITGFRLCNGGAKKYFNLQPDITTYGKVIGGGLPIGVVAGRKKYLDFTDGGEWHFNDDSAPTSLTTFVAGTFCNHPLAMAASKATLQKLKVNNDLIQDSLNRATEKICKELNTFFKKHDYPIRMAHFGSLFRFVVNGKNRFIYQSLLKEKIYLWEGRTCFISTAHSEAEIEILCNLIKKCVVEHSAATLLNTEKDRIQTGAFRKMTCRLLVEGELDLNALDLAFAIVMENASASMQPDISYHIAGNLEELKERSHSVVLHRSFSGEKTGIQIDVDASVFDGWSVTSILRIIGTTYDALIQSSPLPLDPFNDTTHLELILPFQTKNKSQSAFKEAFSVSSYIPSDKFSIQKTYLFECLLIQFARALGIDKIKIGVPVSGQMLYRRFKALGNFTTHVPVSIDLGLPEQLLRNSIAEQLTESKIIFGQWFKGELKSDHRVVFNLDNLLTDFCFGSRKVKIEGVSDHSSQYDLVCNVVAEPSGLHISIKYSSDFQTSEASSILKRFRDQIIQYKNDAYSFSR